MEVTRSEKFERSYKRLVKNDAILEKKITKAVVLFKNTPHHPSLRLHKLKGNDIWSISVNMQLRIILIYQENLAILLDIGDHSIYD